ncbi:hypothetical protein CANTEDRAFT_131251 [Yamadazyma tenuis ATCC 10573]|uniref:Zn(2)-C6 fungal-type domain-containing protein n=1 Tax=Candida tenuis (strain ATCC 10573 / BCRC 21748 / CBS 615 / JCM 9827 / NBRC 10315 / NRRL Y-1498 / VKM Y-70) TaxID=590646 RepID=G3B8K5_CANTC|nr:uncharacterized protein CANTEDRAFT_131251 [Yamadazyma tenuis ATCC 10573]EGV61755.1 hypothetical protein CANTEDRAFT_131251 [Yamadazyma tenuis ATCC 10573]
MSIKFEDSDTIHKIDDSRRKKVDIACVYCRRSHMICDNSRPCSRCIKRGIGHLCYDEPSNARQKKKASELSRSESSPGPPGASVSPPAYGIQQSLSSISQSPIQAQQQPISIQHSLSAGDTAGQPKNFNKSVLSQTMAFNLEPFFYSEHAGSEFSSLNDFLSMIDDPELVNGALNEDTPTSTNNDSTGLLNFGLVENTQPNPNPNPPNGSNSASTDNIQNILTYSPNSSAYQQFSGQYQQSPQQIAPVPVPPTPLEKRQPVSSQKSQTDAHQPVISDAARDKFFLTAADPTTEISPEERLKQVIKAKLEAGLLQPYNYAKGYGRLQNYMDNYMNSTSRQRILKPLSVFRPAFRAIARTLKDVDLVLVEESFERMLLDYDRVFTSMAIPACLWRRTGEIYRGNKEFASLVGVTTDDLKDGKLAIYELMSEESAVNFWEKYGAIAFDKGQKAVLTSCNLRTRDGIKRKSCCFSFTIRRDRYNIPSCIVGNFIPIDP